jgi:hypothetical protein
MLEILSIVLLQMLKMKWSKMRREVEKQEPVLKPKSVNLTQQIFSNTNFGVLSRKG